MGRDHIDERAAGRDQPEVAGGRSRCEERAASASENGGEEVARSRELRWGQCINALVDPVQLAGLGEPLNPGGREAAGDQLSEGDDAVLAPTDRRDRLPLQPPIARRQKGDVGSCF
jgi:hypothetical protein